MTSKHGVLAAVWRWLGRDRGARPTGFRRYELPTWCFRSAELVRRAGRHERPQRGWPPQSGPES